MSEIINNRQQRIEIMKGLIRQLHSGASEDKIIGIAPPYKNLKNPILRRTVARLATLEKIAMIGGQDVSRFINTLRREVGQEELTAQVPANIIRQKGDPEWLQPEPAEVVDGVDMLGKGIHPLGYITEAMKKLKKGQYILLTTNFKPLPMIEAMEKQGYEVFTKTDEKNNDFHYTFIRKN
ncbi:MAG: DUF1858 domain-containing protein [Calditrichaceae bacterium]|nr:DUF1858 domain-containing protein [Calditrichaceae bacterium]MBN2710216.1 DUF1858 domain-containing protein [Calditrichaceae bacterium]RQV92856.1 MAG: DUF1858 domain-containing protein [Calditrichota bacterium]